MIRRLMFASLLVALAFVGVGTGTRPVDAQQASTLRFATLGDVTGPWERPLGAWRTQIARDTQGKVTLNYDERGGNPVTRMQNGEIDGAFLSVVSLGEIDPSLLVLNAPGVITSYEDLDRVRNRIGNRFAGILDQKGYKLLGWFDLGQVRFFATKPILQPSDLRAAKAWALPQDHVFSSFLSAVGANPVRLPIERVKAAIPNRVDVVPASALAAYGLEWYPKLPFVSQQARGVVTGMTVMRKDRFEALTPEQQATLTSTSERVHELIRSRLRQQDESLFRTITSRDGVQTFDLSTHSAEWQAAAAQARREMTGELFPAAVLSTVTRAAAQ